MSELQTNVGPRAKESSAGTDFVSSDSSRMARPPLGWLAVGMIVTGAALALAHLEGDAELLRFAFLGCGLGLLILKRRRA